MMNGYELADEIEQQIKDDMPTKIEENWLRKIQTMLRQQADRIAELEKKQQAILTEVKTSWTAISPVKGMPRESAQQLYKLIKEIIE